MDAIGEELQHVRTAEIERHNRLIRDVVTLSHTIGERNLSDYRRYGALRVAEAWLRGELVSSGIPHLRRARRVQGRDVANLEVTFGGLETTRWWIVGAHYDSARSSPGGSDDATGVALLLELARAWLRRRDSAGPVGLRLVFFSSGEPHSRAGQLGSSHYARECRERGDQIEAMISLDVLGTPLRRSPFSPGRGEFVAVVGDPRSRALVRAVSDALSATLPVRVRELIASKRLPLLKSSDHESFWDEGYPAVMLTDAAPLRRRRNRRIADTPDRVDFVRLAHLARALPDALDALIRR